MPKFRINLEKTTTEKGFIDIEAANQSDAEYQSLLIVKNVNTGEADADDGWESYGEQIEVVSVDEI